MDTRKDLPVIGACLSFGSLKTEEKTERQCGQYAPTLGWTRNCLSISLSASQPAATRIPVVRRKVGACSGMNTIGQHSWTLHTDEYFPLGEVLI